MPRRYSIPYNINANFFNTKTPLKDEKTGIGIDKKFSVRVILTFICAMAAYMWLVFQSPLSKILSPLSGSWLGFGLFTAGYIGMAYFSLREISIPEQYGYNVYQPLMHWLHVRRHPIISTKRFEPYSNGMKLTGMLEPTETGGYLRFQDGSYGITYKITGTASENAFGYDRKHSINTFNRFLRTMPMDTTITFLTNTGGQKVDRQLNHLMDLYQHETNIAMMQYIVQQIQELGGYVQHNFFALHQYMLIRGRDKMVLRDSDKQIQNFVRSSDGSAISMMERLTPEAERNLYKTIYCGLSIRTNRRWEEFEKEHNNEKSDAEKAGSRMADIENKPVDPRKIVVRNRNNNSVIKKNINHRKVNHSRVRIHISRR